LRRQMAVRISARSRSSLYSSFGIHTVLGGRSPATKVTLTTLLVTPGRGLTVTSPLLMIRTLVFGVSCSDVAQHLLGLPRDLQPYMVADQAAGGALAWPRSRSQNCQK